MRRNKWKANGNRPSSYSLIKYSFLTCNRLFHFSISFVLSSDHLNSTPLSIFCSISCFFSRPTNTKASISNKMVADGSLSQILRNSSRTLSSGKYISTPSRIISTGDLLYALTFVQPVLIKHGFSQISVAFRFHKEATAQVNSFFEIKVEPVRHFWSS